MALPAPDWLGHRLTVTGPVEALAAFRAAAAGAGVVPWRLTAAGLEEGWFGLLAAVPSSRRRLSIAGVRILACQLREAVETRHAAALDRVGRDRSCPFDLQALFPVPAAVLALGPEHPAALAWLWENWGTTWPLRHVWETPPTAAERRRLPVEHGIACFVFHSADWSPWRALARLRADWPGLGFALVPEYGSPS